MMTEAFESLVKRSLDAIEPTEEDYMQDGLLYCGKCHTALQTWVTLPGLGEKLVGVTCKCRQEREQTRQALSDRKDRYYETMARLDYLDLRVKPDERYFDPRCRKYLDKWPQMLKNGVGLILWGDVGRGKSNSAACIVDALRKQYVPALTVNLVQFDDVKTAVPNLRGIDLLVVDDLGTERKTEFALERAFEVIDQRTQCKKPTIYTTNLDLKVMQNPKNYYDANYARIYERLYSRVLERAVAIHFVGGDHRMEHKAAVMDWATTVMGLGDTRT